MKYFELKLMSELILKKSERIKNQYQFNETKKISQLI
jgi:hypothetical protein